MNKYKIFTFVLVAALLLGACATPPTTKPPEATAPPVQEQPTTAPEATTAPAENITIKFWHQEQVDVRVKVLQVLLDKFHELNPNITVVQETMTWDEQFVKIMSALEAGNVPDLLWGTEGTAVTLQDTGKILPVTDIVEAIDKQYSYVPAHRDVLKWNGEYWGVPIFGLSYNFWYRKDLFKAAGIEPPKTWDELLAAAEKLNKPSEQKWGIALPASGTLYGDQVVVNFLYSNGGDIMGKGNKLTLNTPEFVQTLDYYSKLAKFAPPDNANYTWPEAGQAFGQSKAGMLATFNAVLDWISTGNTPDNLGIIPFPAAAGKESYTIGYTLNIMMLTPDPAKQDAIKKFLAFMLEPDNYGTWAAEFEPGLFLPITKAGLDSKTYWANEKVAPYADQIRTAMELTTINKAFGFVAGEKPLPGLGPLGNGHVLADAAQKVIFGEMTPEEAAAWAQKQGEDLLAQQ